MCAASVGVYDALCLLSQGSHWATDTLKYVVVDKSRGFHMWMIDLLITSVCFHYL